MKISAVLVFSVVLAVLPVLARSKTDVLVMSNGDRLQCEIKSLDAGVLLVKLDYVKGSIQVDWAKVRYVESKQLFLVKTQDGSAYTGTLSTAETEGARPVELQIVEDSGQNVEVPRQQVVDLFQTSDSFWHRLNGSINSGMTYSKANASRQYNFSSDVEYPRERWSAGADYNSSLTANTGASTATRNNVSAYYRRLLRWDQWFYTGLGSALQSSEQDIDLQSNIGGGIGRYLKNTNRATIAAFAGLAYQNTRYSQSEGALPSQNVLAVMIGASAELFKFNKTNLTIAANVYPAISQPGRVYSDLNATYYIKFWSDLTWNLSFYGNWDNQPPERFSGADYGTSIGLGWKFGNK